MNKQKRKYFWLLPILLVALVNGCFLISGTWVIIFEVEQADIHTDSDSTFYKFTVDLTKEKDWQDNKDKLNSIEDITLTFKLKNAGDTTIVGRVYVSLDSNLANATEVETSATIILDGIDVPPDSTRYFDMAHYYDLLQNFDTLRDLVEGGVFTAYAIVPVKLHIELSDVVVIVTIDAGL